MDIENDDLQEQQSINYYIKIHQAWLKHCAPFVKPCAHTLAEVEEYLKSRYDVEPVDLKENKRLTRMLLEWVDVFYSSSRQQAALKQIPLTASHEEFERIHNESLQTFIQECCAVMARKNLKPHGYRILRTEKNDNLIKQNTRYHGEPDKWYHTAKCGYVLWDEATEAFCFEGYGSLELWDDISIYHGVSQEDIDNLTYRFVFFTRYLPLNENQTSREDFEKDMDMCFKYGFKNTQYRIAEMLEACLVEYEIVNADCVNRYKDKWYECFGEDDERGYLLWGALPSEDLSCLSGKQAVEALDSQNKGECILFLDREDFAFVIKDAFKLDSYEINMFSDIYLVDKNFSWTYVHTHESYCGPYFYKNID